MDCTCFIVNVNLCVCVDRVDDDLELSVVCHRPEGLEQLEALTKFNKKELQVLYRGFKNVCRLTHTFRLAFLMDCCEIKLTHTCTCVFSHWFSGMSQWRGQRGDVQTDLLAVLSSRGSVCVCSLSIHFSLTALTLLDYGVTKFSSLVNIILLTTVSSMHVCYGSSVSLETSLAIEVATRVGN